MHSEISFLGAAGQVTGSNFLLNTGNALFLIDCGLSQGRHSAEAENWDAFAFDPKAIDVLVVTHAHIDHIGRIPKLVKDGFAGTIISTAGTKTLAMPLLLDAQELLQHAAVRHGKEALYDKADIDQALKLWKGVGYHEPQQLKDEVTLEFFDSGHILGSAIAMFSRGGKKVGFTGDLGSGNSPLLPPVEHIKDADYLVIESVYGDRVRDKEESRHDLLEDVVENTAVMGGTLLIPAFSTERTQDLLFDIRELMQEGRVPTMPVYIDSPLASQITQAYLSKPEYFNDEMKERVRNGEDIFAFPQLRYVENVEESAGLSKLPGPKVIIAGSGMSNGGRAQNHEKRVLPDSNSTVLVVGYQAAGSLGRRLTEGEKKVEIQKELIPVRAHIEEIYSYSAHMDSEQLLEFVNIAAEHKTLKEAFVVMGEPASAAFLAQRIRDYLSVKATTPFVGDKASIDF